MTTSSIVAVDEEMDSGQVGGRRKPAGVCGGGICRAGIIGIQCHTDMGVDRTRWEERKNYQAAGAWQQLGIRSAMQRENTARRQGGARQIGTDD